MKNLSTVLVVLAAGSSYVAALPTRGPHTAVQARGLLSFGAGAADGAAAGGASGGKGVVVVDDGTED